jgi:hypothetical protein
VFGGGAGTAAAAPLAPATVRMSSYLGEVAGPRELPPLGRGIAALRDVMALHSPCSGETDRLRQVPQAVCAKLGVRYDACGKCRRARR